MMYFGTPAKLSSVNNDTITTNTGNVDIVRTFKYFGLILGGRLRFDAHVKYMSKKIYPKHKALSKVRGYIGVNTALTLFYSLI